MPPLVQLLPVSDGIDRVVVGLVLRLDDGCHLVTCGACAARFRLAPGSDPFVVLDGHLRQCAADAGATSGD